ncbi:MAG: sirohydrochlorin cobaltochelatase [Dorea sp.]|uniref:sirohydrochlorin cobaltochelatase n=1 Tax=Dorea sp. YH-dor226 TaxID=3151119 RepID=UPI003042C816|nr:sirohydrochlorin cobaltochelatase [Dorea sp.]
MAEKRGILVVSFGTAYAGTRQLTIEKIRNTIQQAYPDCAVYEAWTSKRIIRKLLETTGERIRTVEEALEEMAGDGIREVYIQPTHVIDGIENERMKEEAKSYKDRFRKMVFGQPLIASKNDMEEMVRIIRTEFSDLHPDEVLVLMGHGSIHTANAAYAQMNQMFGQSGRQNIYLCTVEAEPGIEMALREIKKTSAGRIRLAPFLIVAGNHAMKDMAGPEEDSWMNLCKGAGYEVDCCMKGLGEYPEVRALFLKHLDTAMRS